MEKIVTENELFYLKVNDLLKLIAGCDNIISRMLALGMKPDDLSIRQELFLKHRFCVELNELLLSENIKVQVIENELQLPKAA
jgi:hypothetical protein